MKKNKWLRSTITTIILILLLIAIYIAISTILANAQIEDIDLTTEKLYTLTQETKDKIANVKETKILLFGMQDYENVVNFAKQYTKQNSNISYEEISDITTRPDLVTKYGIGSTSTAIVVETEDKTKILTTADLYTYDYTTYEQIDITEESITNAILDVNLEKKPKIYIVTNHVRYDDSLQIVTEYLKNEANDVENIDLVISGSVPEDCSVLFFTDLDEDITEFEKQIIIDYINNGGKIIILTEPNTENIDFKNFNQILDIYGVSVGKGYIYEQDSNKMIRNYASIIMPDLSYSSDITRYISTGDGVIFINPGKLEFKTDEELENLNVEVTNLVTASETAFYRTNISQTTKNRIAGDEDAGGASLGAYITKKIENGTTELAIFSNSIFASDLPVQIGSGTYDYGIYFANNKDLILNTVAKLTQRTDTITVRKDTGLITYVPTEIENTIITIIIIALPIFIILTGIIVWIVRRGRF